jgi:hypothetical protein
MLVESFVNTNHSFGETKNSSGGLFGMGKPDLKPSKKKLTTLKNDSNSFKSMAFHL